MCKKNEKTFDYMRIKCYYMCMSIEAFPEKGRRGNMYHFIFQKEDE